MSKISQKAAQALLSHKSFTQSNTKVTVHETHTTMQLHGKEIARLNQNGQLSISDGGWPTVTTRSRLAEVVGQHTNWQTTLKLSHNDACIYILPTEKPRILAAGIWQPIK